LTPLVAAPGVTNPSDATGKSFIEDVFVLIIFIYQR